MELIFVVKMTENLRSKRKQQQETGTARTNRPQQRGQNTTNYL